MSIFNNFAVLTTFILTSKWVVAFLAFFQIFLSTRLNHKNGLIIPGIYAVHIILLFIFSAAAYLSFSFEMYPTFVFMLNEATYLILYTIIYFVCGIRRRDRKKAEANKIDIKNI